MIVAPRMKTSNLTHLPPGSENSSTMTSEQAMYKKVPPAREEKMTSTMSEVFWRMMPRVTPTGVAKEKVNSIQNTVLKSPGNPLPRAKESENPAHPLWIRMATIRSMHLLEKLKYNFYVDKSDSNPTAIPSKIECTLNANINTNGVKLRLQHKVLGLC